MEFLLLNGVLKENHYFLWDFLLYPMSYLGVFFDGIVVISLSSVKQYPHAPTHMELLNFSEGRFVFSNCASFSALCALTQ